MYIFLNHKTKLYICSESRGRTRGGRTRIKRTDSLAMLPLSKDHDCIFFLNHFPTFLDLNFFLVLLLKTHNIYLVCSLWSLSRLSLLDSFSLFTLQDNPNRVYFQISQDLCFSGSFLCFHTCLNNVDKRH